MFEANVVWDNVKHDRKRQSRFDPAVCSKQKTFVIILIQVVVATWRCYFITCDDICCRFVATCSWNQHLRAYSITLHGWPRFGLGWNSRRSRGSHGAPCSWTRIFAHQQARPRGHMLISKPFLYMWCIRKDLYRWTYISKSLYIHVSEH